MVTIAIHSIVVWKLPTKSTLTNNSLKTFQRRTEKGDRQKTTAKKKKKKKAIFPYFRKSTRSREHWKMTTKKKHPPQSKQC